jgi:hypothetical protein
MNHAPQINSWPTPQMFSRGVVGSSAPNIVLQSTTGYGDGSVFGTNRSIYHGGILYFSDGTNLFALDTTVPSIPVELSTLVWGEVIESLSAVGEYLFGLARSGVLYTVDISNPGEIAVVATFDPAISNFYGWPQSIIKDGFLYCIGHYDGGGDAGFIVCFDVTSPLSVSLTATVRDPDASWGGGGLAIVGNTLWVCDYFSKAVNGIAVFHSLDISTPAAMAITGTTDATVSEDANFETWRMLSSGTALLIFDDYVIECWDVTNPGTPVLITVIDATLQGGADVEGVSLLTGYILTAINGDTRINAYDIGDPTTPVFLDSYVQVSGVANLSNPNESARLVAGIVGGFLNIWSY